MPGHGSSADDAARFLRELRELRHGAGLDHAELAARAHYPYDRIKAAEAGPALPDLPVLSAFVRGCGGTTEEWEERWRSLTRSPSLPLPDLRQGGDSAAATAGARVGSASEPGDDIDPSVIIAALNRVAEEMASGSDGPAGKPVTDEMASGSDEPTGKPVFDEMTSGSDELTGEPGAQPGIAVPLDVTPVFPPDVTPVEPPTAPWGEPWPAARATGWDPIRVSSAWPAIKDTPLAAVPSAHQESSADPGRHPRAASRKWIAVLVVVVVLCALAAALAIFA